MVAMFGMGIAGGGGTASIAAQARAKIKPVDPVAVIPTWISKK